MGSAIHIKPINLEKLIYKLIPTSNYKESEYNKVKKFYLYEYYYNYISKYKV